MDEYLSEKEQIERLREWWRENGWYLISGVALGALLLFGWNQYRAYQDREAEGAAALYQSLKIAVEAPNADEATALLNQLREEYPASAYADQAGLLIARMLLITSPERAAAELRFVMDTSDERELSMIARLRLARVLAYREQYDEALQLLAVDDSGQFTGRLNEVKGDIYVARGETEAARVAYLSAMTASGAEVLDRNFLQMKLNDLPGATAESDEPAASEQPTAPAGAEPAPESTAQERRSGGGGRVRKINLARALLVAMLVAIAMQLAACAGSGKDTVEPPAELTDIEQTLRVRKLWSSKVGGSAERLRLGLRPASDGARIYAGSHEGQAAAFDAETGRKLWSVKTELPLAAGPAAGEGIVVFGTTDGELVALDAASGMERWRQSVGSEVLAPPAIAPNVILVRTVDGRLRGFSARDGVTLWTVEQNLPALTLRGNTAPRVAGSMVVSGFNNGRVGAYEVGTGEVIWELAVANPTGRSELERLVDVSAGMQVVGTEVYVVGYQGRAVGIDLNSGVVLWQQDMSSYAGLGADFNNIYVTNDVGAVVALDRRGGTPVWRQEALRLRDVTAPTRYGNAVVVGDLDGYLHWLDPNDGHFIARQRASSDRITAAPLVVGQNVFVQGDDGTVAAFTVQEDAA